MVCAVLPHAVLTGHRLAVPDGGGFSGCHHRRVQGPSTAEKETLGHSHTVCAHVLPRPAHGVQCERTQINILVFE